MAWPPIQQKKQDNKKSSEDRGWRQLGRGEGVGQNLKKGLDNIGGGGGGIHKTEGVRNPKPNM